MARPRTSREVRGRIWTVLMTVVAIAAVREAAFARNKARSPLTIPDPPTPTGDA